VKPAPPVAVDAPYTAPALEKGLDILELLAGEGGGLLQNAIAQRLSRSATELFRMLSVLERRGYVLITASLAAILHAPPLSHYSATKAGVEAFGDSIRLDLRHLGVDVGVAYFGFIDTPMVARGKADPILAQFDQENGQNFVGKTYPLSGAGAAVLTGMENRSRRVMYPRFIRPMYALRSLMPRALGQLQRHLRRAGPLAQHREQLHRHLHYL